MTQLDRKTALITGGGRGFGFDMVERFVSEGATVTVLEIERKLCDHVSERFPAKQVQVICGDVSVEQDVAASVKRCLEAFGGLHIVVNNAATQTATPLPITELAMDDWTRILDVNLNGPLRVIAQSAPHMKAGGSIINITSISADAGYPNAAAYSVSKSALEALSRQAALELGPKGIRVNSICPGWFRTELNEHVYKDPGVVERRNKVIPMARIGAPIDVTEIALFLASDRSTYISGASIKIDGGLGISGLMAALRASSRPS